MDFLDRLRAALEADPSFTLFDFRNLEYARGTVREWAERTMNLLEEAGMPTGVRIGVVVRNRPCTPPPCSG